MNHRVPSISPKDSTDSSQKMIYPGVFHGIPSPWMTFSLPGSIASFFVIHQASLINHIHMFTVVKKTRPLPVKWMNFMHIFGREIPEKSMTCFNY